MDGLMYSSWIKGINANNNIKSEYGGHSTWRGKFTFVYKQNITLLFLNQACNTHTSPTQTTGMVD